MADILCGYTADRDETLVGYLYGEIEPAQRAAFEAHTATCERCRKELADLGGVRSQLQDWTAPEAIRPVVHDRVQSARVVPSPPPAGVWTALNQVPGPKEPLPLIESEHDNLTPQKGRACPARTKEILDLVVKGGEYKP